MEEKLEQIIAEKFDKMGLNNDDDDDEEDNLAPFRKEKKASRIEKRVQKAVAGIQKQVVREHVWTAQRKPTDATANGRSHDATTVRLSTAASLVRPVRSTSRYCAAACRAAATQEIAVLRKKDHAEALHRAWRLCLKAR